MEVQFGPLQFRPVDWESSREICIRFRIDSYFTSFGSRDRFYTENGAEGEKYIAWLVDKLAKKPWSVVHVWESNEIVGQLELGRYNPDPAIGYVNLYYLVPHKRGQKLSRYLEEYVTSYMKKDSHRKARLSVSPTNQAALGFYRKHGWRDLGPRPNHPEVHFMEKDFSV